MAAMARQIWRWNFVHTCRLKEFCVLSVALPCRARDEATNLRLLRITGCDPRGLDRLTLVGIWSKFPHPNGRLGNLMQHGAQTLGRVHRNYPVRYFSGAFSPL